MQTDYCWASPGGTYCVPDDFKARFLAEFPTYRIRWSLKDSNWHIEQRIIGESIPPFDISPEDDTLIRFRDGCWRVMAIQPGDRMPCPGIIQKRPRQVCGFSLNVPHRVTREVVCPICRSKGRDGRTIATFWPFDECLIEHLRRGNPLTYGVVKEEGKTQTRAAFEVDRRNALNAAEADRRRRDAGTLDAVDYRWLTGIGSSSGRSRHADDLTFR